MSLEEKWKLLTSDAAGYKSLRIDAHCIPDLFIGIYNSVTRCLILKLPAGYEADFQPTEKAHLSLELFPDMKWVVLKLLDNRFSDLFNDLILSLYSRLWDKLDANDYCPELISTFQKWSEFFDERIQLQLSEETISGIFGELVILKDFMASTPSSGVNDLLYAWTGPFHHRHDFSFGQRDIEVKTKDTLTTDILISSEYQLQAEPGNRLELYVVSLVRELTGMSLKELVLDIRKTIITKMADFTILLKSMFQYGLNINNLTQYDHYRFIPVSLDIYDCTSPDFPKLIQPGLPPGISKLRYHLRTTGLAPFLIASQNF